MRRTDNIKELGNNLFDIAIIGGGITGAGILREATNLGYRCVLSEKNDFASGTSSKSAKLVHGGLRYLQYGKFALVREGLHERHYLLKTFPHLVKPLQFLFPVFSSPLKFHFAMWAYKLLTLDKDLAKYRFLNKQQTIEDFPAIDQNNLKASFIYYDAVTNDARLCNEIIAVAQQGGAIALNYFEFLLVEDKKDFFEIHCNDKISTVSNTFKAKYIINASGHWTDEVLEKLNYKNPRFGAPSKGVHLVLSRERFPAEKAILFPSYANDGRMMYAVPWENNSVVIGTTDTEKIDSLDKITINESDVTYILNSIQCFAPMLNISEKDILGSFAGLRPLLREDAQSKDRTRDYRCWWSHKRVINILGGKLTSFHAMASTVLKKVQMKYPSPQNPIAKVNQQNSGNIKDYNLPENLKIETLKKYGDESQKILAIANENNAYSEYLRNDIRTIVAEIIYFTRFQNCQYLDDVLTRRLSLSYVLKNYQNIESIISRVAEIMAIELEWTKEEKENEIANYRIAHNLIK